ISVTRPSFSWQAVASAKYYTLNIFSGTNCNTPWQSVQYLTSTAYTLGLGQALPYGTYCWNVQAADALVNWGPASSMFHVVVNGTTITGPGTPILLVPISATNWTPATLPALTWTMNGVTGNKFHVQIDTTATFSNPKRDVVVLTDQFTYAVAGLPAGLYY